MKNKEEFNRGKALNGLGCCLAIQEKWEEAVQRLEEACELEPENSIYANNLERCLLVRDNPGLALINMNAISKKFLEEFVLGIREK